MKNKKVTMVVVIVIILAVALLAIFVSKKMGNNKLPIAQEVPEQEVIPEGYAKYTDQNKGFSFLYPSGAWGSLEIDQQGMRDGTNGEFTFYVNLDAANYPFDGTDDFYIKYGGATSNFSLTNPNEMGRDIEASDYAQNKEAFKKLLDKTDEAEVSSVAEDFVTDSGVQGLKIAGIIPLEKCEMGCFFPDTRTIYYFELEKFPGGIFFEFSNKITEKDAVMKTLKFFE